MARRKGDGFRSRLRRCGACRRFGGGSGGCQSVVRKQRNRGSVEPRPRDPIARATELNHRLRTSGPPRHRHHGAAQVGVPALVLPSARSACVHWARRIRASGAGAQVVSRSDLIAILWAAAQRALPSRQHFTLGEQLARGSAPLARRVAALGGAGPPIPVPEVARSLRRPCATPARVPRPRAERRISPNEARSCSLAVKCRTRRRSERLRPGLLPRALPDCGSRLGLRYEPSGVGDS
jgi:hypothetical protein